MKRTLLIICILSLVISPTVYAQQVWTNYYRNIVDDITAITFEDDIIWLGTYNGLARYNTKTGESIPFTEKDSLIHNEINGIAVDNNGLKWIATNEGISMFDGVSFTSMSKQELGYTEILDVAVDSNNTKWFIAQDAVLKYDDVSWHAYTLENGLPVGSLKTIAIDTKDTIWIGTKKRGIVSFDGAEWILYEDYRKNIVSIAIGEDNTKWFGDYNGSVISYDGVYWSQFQVVSSMWFLYSVSVAPDNSLWVSTNFGLNHIQNGEIKLFNEENGLLESFSRTIAFDNNGDIWIAGYRGLTRFDGNQFTHDLGFTGPLNANISSIAIDNNNVKWFGHRTHQLLYFNNIKWSVIDMAGYTDLANQITVTKDNIVWFTAGIHGALIYNGSSIERANITLATDFGATYREVLQGVVADRNTVWLCTTGFITPMSSHTSRILRYDNLTVSNSVPVRRNYNNLTHISLDSRNYLWIAEQEFIDNHGLSYFDGISIIKIPTYFNHKVKIHGIFADSYNTIWVLSEDGLYMYYDEKLHQYTTSNSGLPSNSIYAVAEDINNTKWIGTDAGVCRFDGETWTTFKRSNSGLCDNKVNAIAVEKNNTIWFGTDNGVSRYTGEVITTSVDKDDETPEALPILHSYPNPFNPSTTIEFTLPKSGFATLSIYNISGQKVRELASDHMTAGTHNLTWNGRNDSGNAVSSGIYITRLQAGKQVVAERMVLMK